MRSIQGVPVHLLGELDYVDQLEALVVEAHDVAAAEGRGLGGVAAAGVLQLLYEDAGRSRGGGSSRQGLDRGLICSCSVCVHRQKRACEWRGGALV